MKRIKDSEIIPLIVASSNIRESIDAVLRGTARKQSKQGREILAHIDGIEAWLAAEISAGVFRLTSYGEEIKSLADLGISTSPGVRRNGQKNFTCREVTLNALVGSTLCILDFQTGVSTKWSRREHKEAVANGDTEAKEKTKYLVCARLIVPNRAQLAACNLPLKKGDVVKFFTGYPDMCDICDALKDKELLGENKVTMARNAQGNFTEYLFT